MTKRVLAVGNCSYDHGNISAAIRKHFDAEVSAAPDADEAIAALTGQTFDLVLINRLLEYDRSPGVDLIRRIRSDPGLGNPPVMLVSNFPEAQAEAVEAGAVLGFGKKSLDSQETVARLREHLG